MTVNKKRLEILSKIGSTDMQELVAYLTEQDKLVTDLKYDIDQYREIDKDHLKRIEVLECEVAMWRKHVPELEATLKRMEQSYLEGITYEYYKAGEAK